MSILPMMSAKEIMRRLERAGFRFKYAKGSHHYFHNQFTGRLTSVPVHGGKDIGRGLLRDILKQAGISPKDFLKL